MAAGQIDRLPNSELYRSPACLVEEPRRIDRLPNPCRRKAAASTVFSEPMSTKRAASSLRDPRKTAFSRIS